MSDTVTTTSAIEAPAPAAPTLPAALRARFNGELESQSIVAWAEYDLDQQNRYGQHFVVLTDKSLVVLDGQADPTSIDLSNIDEAKTIEGLGVDRLSVIVADKLAAELRYTRRHRRDMTRLQRKLARRIPKKDSKENDLTPERLETVE